MPNLDALRRTVSSTLVVAARKWRRTSHGVLAAFNVSEACATPLLTASRLGSAVRQVTLADHVGIEGPSLVRLLDQLCAAGLMRRDEDPEDRRAKTVVLTEEGRAVTARMEEELVTLRAQALKGVSRSDLEAALRVLEAFTSDAAERADPGSAKREPGHSRGRPPSQRAERDAPGKAAKAAQAAGAGRGAAKAHNNQGGADIASPHDADDPA
ncbi:MarR family winged helix-turn-helix transcriptional regulator [Paraburkholderia metrosideri]|jgi:MarR family transcriptional regulator for hemolysin|uniref:Transcriptional regulator SlyA n=1 Tax=Paraburkholderia metrosideri TaxID=580937 RepID=A0ABN7I9R8_9BURK|nr:MarR family transcriptional regulator [Paraburkholderia metrosideri]CAD6551883.1 Transcriptional regulator SlyA [Paraburkholderia metrosideri]